MPLQHKGWPDDYEEAECWQCGGEGFVYGCSWDWQCDTYDEGEGTCLCTRRCDVCNPAPRNPELDRIMAEALACPASAAAARSAETAQPAQSEGRQSGPAKQGDAQTTPPKDSPHDQL